MRTAIPLRSDPLSTALDWSRQLGRRAERDAASRLSRDLWTVTAEAALARKHPTVVANLLGSELVPAVGEAVAALGQAVALASTPRVERHPAWTVEMLPKIDTIARKHKRACDVIVVAELRRESLGGPPPLYREPGSTERVLERVLGGLGLELEGRDGWAALGERLGRGLCGLVEPVDALVERMDADDLDGVPLMPLKRAFLAVHEDMCELLLLTLARLDLERRSPPPRFRASA